MTSVCEGSQLESMKVYMAQCWGVSTALTKRGCIICKPHGICGKLYHTEPGRLEYHITGVCESCYDGFMSEQGSKSFRDLSTIGYDLMMLWLIISRVHTSVIGLPAVLIAAISTGTFNWPQAGLPASASAVDLR